MYITKISVSWLFVIMLSSSITSVAGSQDVENYRFLLQQLPSPIKTTIDVEAEISRIGKSEDLAKVSDTLTIWHQKLASPSQFQDMHDSVVKNAEHESLTQENSAPETSFSQSCCGKYSQRTLCTLPLGTGGTLAGAGVGGLVGTAFGMLGGAFTGMTQSFSEHFDWNLVWIVGGSIGGGTLLVCASAGAAGGALLGWWKGPALWKSLKGCCSCEPRALSFKEIARTLGIEHLSSETLKHLELIYNNLIMELPVQEV